MYKIKSDKFSIKNSIEYLLSIESKGIKMGLERTKALNESCGSPNKNLKIIQVAGTNGKGSTCAMISSILNEVGYNVGLFTSPHLIKVNERIRINGIFISDNEIHEFITLYKKNIEKISASFFETITIMAFWYFQKYNVDYAIMETGLGGRLDSVTICNPILTVITSISMDHSEILGDSLPKIAKEKVGIIKENIPCVTIKHPNEVGDIIALECTKKKSDLIITNDFIKLEYSPSLKGNIQLENAKLAQVAIATLFKDIDQKMIINGIEKTKWHGRNQLIQENPIVIFDVAHNKAGIRSFLEFSKYFNVEKKRLILSLQSRKNIKSLSHVLYDFFDEIILCETHNKRSMKIDELQSNFECIDKLICIKSPNKAIQYALVNSKEKDFLGIIGTHYLGDSISKIFNISFN